MRFMSLNLRVIQIMSLLYSYSELFRYFLFNTLQILGADDAFYMSLNLRVIQIMSLLYSYSELFRYFHELLKCAFLSPLTLFNLAEKPEAECEGKARSTDTVECVSECINK